MKSRACEATLELHVRLRTIDPKKSDAAADRAMEEEVVAALLRPRTF